MLGFDRFLPQFEGVSEWGGLDEPIDWVRDTRRGDERIRVDRISLSYAMKWATVLYAVSSLLCPVWFVCEWVWSRPN